MNEVGLEECRRSIAHHSKSFALASRLFSRRTADRAAVLYAWCRRVDDGVDTVEPADQPAALARLRRELEGIDSGRRPAELELQAFQDLVRGCTIPVDYPEELLAGMEMDVLDTPYATMEELLLYCHRVAGVVGLMMCHVMGVAEASALRRAAHLGIAMQLTNICRDVLEDWEMGRLYVPDQLLDECGAPELRRELGGVFPDQAAEPMARAVRSLLREADRYYASGDRGLAALPWRCALAVRTARRVYSAIGRRVEDRDCDVRRGRAVVPLATKLRLAAGSLGAALRELPRRARQPHRPLDLDPRSSGRPLRFPEDVLPVEPSSTAASGSLGPGRGRAR